MDYKILIDRLNHRGLFHIKPGLERIQTVLHSLGNPQDNLHCIHIAGTNGKGSVAACLESVLRHAGYRTGLYTSPHLSDVRERIQINRLPITVNHFQTLALKVFAAEETTRTKLTYFEFITAISFLAFTDLQVDVVILEAGMGGRWDATNILKHPVLTVITSVGLDHVQWLGKTETVIAAEKAGILKHGAPLISGVRGKSAKVIERAAQAMSIPLWQIDQQFHAAGHSADWVAGTQTLLYKGIQGSSKQHTLALLGRYQIDNAAIALAALEALGRRGFKIPAGATAEGLADVSWAGRCQVIHLSQGPTVLFDGAHNPPAMLRLLEALRESPWRKSRKHFVFSVYRDKDYRSMLAMIHPQAEQIYISTMPGARALPARQIAAALGPALLKGRVVSAPHLALKKAIQNAAAEDLIVVTGSLTLVGQLLLSSSRRIVSREPVALTSKPLGPGLHIAEMTATLQHAFHEVSK